MRIAKDTLKAKPFSFVWFYLFGYVCCFKWEGVESMRFAKTYDEALEWAACYPHNATVLIGKRGKLVGARFS